MTMLCLMFLVFVAACDLPAGVPIELPTASPGCDAPPQPEPTEAVPL